VVELACVRWWVVAACVVVAGGVVCIAAAVPLTASNNSEDSSLGDRSLRVLAGAIRSPASANGFISLL
jgi:hypothetical protein